MVFHDKTQDQRIRNLELKETLEDTESSLLLYTDEETGSERLICPA